MSFRLYPVEQHWCSYQDYGAVLDVTRRVHPTTVLEFGPGWSTLALIEGGAIAIDCCEDDPAWCMPFRNRVESRYPSASLVQYTWAEPLTIPEVDGKRYDLGLVDGPADTTKRPEVVAYALARCASVLVPLEEDSGPAIRAAVDILARRRFRPVDVWHTGPLAGSYALIGPPC